MSAVPALCWLLVVPAPVCSSLIAVLGSPVHYFLYMTAVVLLGLGKTICLCVPVAEAAMEPTCCHRCLGGLCVPKWGGKRGRKEAREKTPSLFPPPDGGTQLGRALQPLSPGSADPDVLDSPPCPALVIDSGASHNTAQPSGHRGSRGQH